MTWGLLQVIIRALLEPVREADGMMGFSKEG